MCVVFELNLQCVFAVLGEGVSDRDVAGSNG